MPIPTCPTDCTATLAAVSFDECHGEFNDSQIEWLMLGVIGNPMTDWSDGTEWTTRIDNTDVLDATKIRRLRVMGSKPVPDSNEKEVSGGRTITGTKSHQVAFKIDETNADNHEFLRQLECGGSVLMWYETSGGLLFGGTEGIEVSIKLDMNIPESRDELIVFEGVAQWKSKFTEERIVSPIAS